MRRIIFIFFFLLIFLFSPSFVFAQENSFVTIVNPQRISSYTKDYISSFKSEKFEVESRNLPATWLVTYDVLKRDDFVGELKKLNKDQELGIFLEVTEPFAKDASVAYNKTDNWHRATSLFLSGYEQKDRVKLIDKIFSAFKEKFGYYPKSVGAWWTDSYSQNYAREKYGITGNLGVSDQYDLDGYQVWGTWWSVPYYPSKINAAVPAQGKNKIEVLQFRWASRDPLNGYSNTNNLRQDPSLFSLQDYLTVGLSDSYFQDLFNLYAVKKPYNKFGHVTVGLEGDMGKDSYKTAFAKQMDIIKYYSEAGLVQILNMRVFADWYSKSFPKISPPSIIESEDLLDTNRRVFWFQNPYYRVGIEHDSGSNSTKIIDLREYYKNLEEPNFKEPNKQFGLYINLPFIVDTVIKPDSATSLALGNFQRIEGNSLVFEKGNIEFRDKEIVLPDFVLPNKTIKINNAFEIPETGIEYRDFSFTIPFTIKRRFPFPVEYLLLVGIVIAGALISFLKKKMILALMGFVLALGILSIIISPGVSFYISQDEYYALKVLESLPNGPARSVAKGNVLVYEKDCLNCNYTSKFKPAAMAGKKGYVSLYSKHSVEVNFNFQIAKTNKEAREILKNKNIKYVYLAKYGDSIEALPYLPQDLNLKRLYINSNAEIWKVK